MNDTITFYEKTNYGAPAFYIAPEALSFITNRLIPTH